MKKRNINNVHQLVGVKKVPKVVPSTVAKIGNSFYSFQEGEALEINGITPNPDSLLYSTKLKRFDDSEVIFWLPMDGSKDYCFMSFNHHKKVSKVYSVDFAVRWIFTLLERIERILRYKYHKNTYMYSKNVLSFFKFRQWVHIRSVEDYNLQLQYAHICICNLRNGNLQEAMRYINYWESGLALYTDFK